MLTIGRARPPRVVEIGDAVAETGAEVEQRRGRPVGHPPVAIGRAGGDALEQREHRPHARLVVERGDEVHLGRARVREADVDPGVDQGADQGVRAVPWFVSRVEDRAGVQDPGRVETPS